MDTDDENEDVARALALSMQEVTAADLTEDAPEELPEQAGSHGSGTRKRGPQTAAEGDESTRKRSSDTVDTVGGAAAAVSTADSSGGTMGVTEQARDLSLHEDSDDEPEAPGPIQYQAASTAAQPAASQPAAVPAQAAVSSQPGAGNAQITPQMMAAALAQALAGMQQPQLGGPQGHILPAGLQSGSAPFAPQAAAVAPAQPPLPSSSVPQQQPQQHSTHNLGAMLQAQLAAMGGDSGAMWQVLNHALEDNSTGDDASDDDVGHHVIMQQSSLSAPDTLSSAKCPAWCLDEYESRSHTPLPERQPVNIMTATVEAVRAALEAAMGVGVQLQGPGYAPSAEATKPDALAITVALSPGQNGCFSLTPAGLDAAVKARVSGFRLRRERQSEFVALAAVHRRAIQQQPGAAEPVGSVLKALTQAAAERALSTLCTSDADDLYFDEGEAAEQLLVGLGADQIDVAFIAAMLERSTYKRTHVLGWSTLLQKAFSPARQLDFLHPELLDPALYRLDHLTRVPALIRALMDGLMPVTSPKSRENLDDAYLGCLLSVGSFPDALAVMKGDLTSPARKYLEGLRNYPAARGEVKGATDAIRRTIHSAHKAAFEIAMRVIKAKVEPPKAGQEKLLAWLAYIAGTNAVRVTGGEVRGVLGMKQLTKSSSDRFCLGATALSLQLCRPFLSGEPKHMVRLDPSYYKTAAYRLALPWKPATLAAAEDAAPSGPAAAPSTVASDPAAVSAAEAADGEDEAPRPQPSWDGIPYLATHFGPARDGQDAAPAPPHFVADCFFITSQLMHTCLIPAVNRYTELLDRVQRKDREKKKQPGGEEGLVQGLSREAWLLMDTCNAQLLDPVFAGDAVQFAVLQIKWLLQLIQSEDARAALALVPDTLPKDAASWLAFCVRMGAADLVSGSDVGGLVAGLVALLECPHIASPLVADKLVTLLLTMLGSSYRQPGQSEAASRALKLAVLGTGAAQARLLPALMRVYSAADAVVGLDVDRDSFDKFSMRHHIDLLLLELWKDPEQKRALTQLAQQAAAAGVGSLDAGKGGSLLVEYARALLNSLMYMLGDSLERFFDVHTIEAAQTDEEAWNKLPPQERKTKEDFCDHQRGLGGSYMRTAVTTLALLLELVNDDDVAAAFLTPSLVPLASFSSLHFLELLVGPKAAGLDIKDPKKIGLDPVKLSVMMSEFMLHLARYPRFVRAVAAQQDYNEAVLSEFHNKVVRGELGNHAHAAGLETLMQQVRTIRSKESGGASGTATEISGSKAEIAALPETALTFSEAEPKDLDAAYVEALAGEQRRDFDSAAPGAYSSLYASLAEATPGDTAAKMRRLQRELRNLGSRTPLPLNAAASIFLRYDSDRIDKMRAIISGPVDTPYEGGLFVFDLFFAPQYPNVPPSMKLETTGNGVARLNPNLYADGKVCLSLLGTFSSGDASERWSPATSSLFQVLLSIQGMILIGDPYFNEPSVEKMRATSEGAATSAEYNFGVQLNTMRWAMIAHLRRPPPGFEQVVRHHFRLLRGRIMRTAARWLAAAADLAGVDDVLLRRMRTTVEELHSLLAVL